MPRTEIIGDLHEKALSLYKRGVSDSAISRIIGSSKSTVGNWRRAQNLPSHNPQRTARMDQVEARRLYDAGYSDGAIARALGFAQGSVSQWRNKEGLPGHYRKPALIDGAIKRKVRRLLREGLTFADAGRETGLHRKSVEHIRATMEAHPRLRRPGQNNNVAMATVNRNPDELYSRIARAVGRAVPGDIAADTISDMYLAVMTGRLKPAEIEMSARQYRGRVLGQFASAFGPRSIDEEIGEDGFSISDLIEDPDAFEAFDQINERIDEAHDAVGW